MWVLYDGDKLTPIEIYDQSVFVQFDPYKLCVYGETIMTFKSLEQAKLTGERVLNKKRY